MAVAQSYKLEVKGTNCGVTRSMTLDRSLNFSMPQVYQFSYGDNTNFKGFFLENKII